MKKILLTTTAMVAFAGAASAEVTLSGSAEMGIVGSNAAGAAGDTQFHNDIDVKFTLSGETDNGLTFGATIDLDEVDAAGNGIPASSNPASVFISGSFGTLTMGDTDGALDWAMQEVGDNVANSIADDHTAHAGFNGNAGHDGLWDGQVLRYDNTFGDFGVALSLEGPNQSAPNSIWGLGVKYNLALGSVDLGLGLGYQSDSVNDIMGLSADAKFGNGFRAIVNYTDLDGALGLDDHFGIGLGYTTGAVSVEFNYGEYSGVLPAADADGYGLAVNYDLGGGAVVMAGYGSGSVGGAASLNTWSLGLGLSF